MVERLVLLRTIDSLWVEHLTELDDMRRGIGLRGYAQQDPLNEFKREAFKLYEELRGLIRHGVATTIFRVTVTRQPAVPAGGDPAVAASLARGAAALDRRQRLERLADRAQRRGRRPERRRRRPRRGRCRDVGRRGGRLGDPARRPGGRRPPRPMRESLGDEPVVERRRRGAVGGRPEARASRRRGARIGRNDPCWCGSGAKYKKCHGR